MPVAVVAHTRQRRLPSRRAQGIVRCMHASGLSAMHGWINRNFRPHRHIEWIGAYLNTCYRIYLPTATEDIYIGEASDVLDRWLAEHGESSAAIVTACNPLSRLLGGAGNRRSQRALLDVLRGLNHPILPGCNRAIDGGWPDEPSFVVAGLSMGGARQLGARYRQHAVVWLGQGQRAQLVWVRG